MKPLKIILIMAVVFISHISSAQTKVFVTEKGKSYHEKSCRLLPKKHIVTTIKRAKVKGYNACKVCVPKKSKQKMSAKKETKPKKVSTTKKTSTRCTAITQKGSQCKRRTRNTSGRCWQHH